MKDITGLFLGLFLLFVIGIFAIYGVYYIDSKEKEKKIGKLSLEFYTIEVRFTNDKLDTLNNIQSYKIPFIESNWFDSEHFLYIVNADGLKVKIATQVKSYSILHMY